MLELDSTEITCSPVGELESRSAADGHQTTHCLGLTATRSRSGIAAWHWPRRSTTCQARRSSGEPGPAAPMADTAIWSTFSWPRANILSARALSLVLVWLVLAFGLCFACSCDQNVLQGGIEFASDVSDSMYHFFDVSLYTWRYIRCIALLYSCIFSLTWSQSLNIAIQ